LTHLEFLTKLK
jgi:hypothetical protein